MQKAKFPADSNTLSEKLMWQQRHTIKPNFTFSLALELNAKLWDKIYRSD